MDADEEVCDDKQCTGIDAKLRLHWDCRVSEVTLNFFRASVVLVKLSIVEDFDEHGWSDHTLVDADPERVADQ